MIVDSCCSIEPTELSRADVIQVPHVIRINNQNRLSSDFSESEILDMYDSDFLFSDTPLVQRALTGSELSSHLLKLAKGDTNSGICLSSSRLLGSTHTNFEAVSLQINSQARALRQEHDNARPLLLRPYSSGNGSAGYTLTYLYIQSLIRKGNNLREIVEELNASITKIQTLTIIQDTSYSSIRIKESGAFISPGDLMGTFNSQFGSNFNVSPIIKISNNTITRVSNSGNYIKGLKKIHAILSKSIKKGLTYKVIVILFSGNVSDIERQDDYQSMLTAAKTHGVQIIIKTMPLAAGITLGPGALSIGMMAK